MKIVFTLIAMFLGGYVGLLIGTLVRRIRGKSTVFVGVIPVMISIFIMYMFGSAGYIHDMSVLQATAAGFSGGMVVVGAFLFWSAFCSE